MDPYAFSLGSPFTADGLRSEIVRDDQACSACGEDVCHNKAECEDYLNRLAAKVEASYLRGL